MARGFPRGCMQRLAPCNFFELHFMDVRPVVRSVQKLELPGCYVPEFDPALENISFAGIVVCEQTRTSSKVGLHPIVKRSLIA
jgi:hypothetical protein